MEKQWSQFSLEDSYSYFMQKIESAMCNTPSNPLLDPHYDVMVC